MKKILLIILALFIGTTVSAYTVNSTNFTPQGTTPISSGDFGLKFTANNTTSITAVTKDSSTAVSTARILGSDYTTLGTASFVGNTATFSTPIDISQGSTYYVTINNGSSGFTTSYGDVASTLPAVNADITFPLTGNAVFKTPYVANITGLTMGGESSLGITGIITEQQVTPPPPVPPPVSTTTPTIIYAGDSLTEAAAVEFPYNHYLVLPSEYNHINLGVSGKYMSAINADKETFLDPLWGESTGNIVVIWAGINDFWGGKTATETYNALVAFCTHERTLGNKVIVLTTISHLGGNPLYSDVTRNQYNEMIRNNWASFADGLADVAADTNLGLDTSYQSTVYFADGAHLTQTGYQLVAEIVQPIIDDILGIAPAPVTYTFTQAQMTRILEILTELQGILNQAQ